MTILSIQSAVAFGHVGNAAAVFSLQRLGFEVWLVRATAAAGARELQLVAAQEEIVRPGELFPAQRVG